MTGGDEAVDKYAADWRNRPRVGVSTQNTGWSESVPSSDNRTIGA
jgi:hypothetical protein